IVITVTMNSGVFAAGPQTTNLVVSTNDPLHLTNLIQLTMQVGNNPCINIGGTIDPCTGIGTFTTSNLINNPPPSGWTWYFGDGDSLNGTQNPVHQYDTTTGTVLSIMAVACNGLE